MPSLFDLAVQRTCCSTWSTHQTRLVGGAQGKAASMEELKDQILLQLFAGAPHPALLACSLGRPRAAIQHLAGSSTWLVSAELR